MSQQWAGLRRLFRLDRGKPDVERGVREEIEFHFAQAVDDLVARGMSAEQARAEAERRFGDVGTTRQQLIRIDQDRAGRDRRSEWWGAFTQDLRYALRGMRRNPGFTAAVVLTLGLGIGANATMFGIVDRTLLRPPAFLHDPSRVSRVWLLRDFDGKTRPASFLQYTRYTDITASSRTSELTAAITARLLAIGLGEQSREHYVQGVSASFWNFFDARPVIGRFFTPAEDVTPEGARVAVLSWGFWQSEYGGRPDIVGQSVHIGQGTYTIIGVAPRGFQGVTLESPAAIIPITTLAGVENPIRPDLPPDLRYYIGYNMSWLEMLVRRKPGVTVEAASADLTAAYQQSYAHEATMRKSLTPASVVHPWALAAPVQRERGPDQHDESRVAVWLVGVSLIVLLIACANVGNLLLARAMRRRREIAVRLALGISGRRLMAQMLTESLLLSLLGGAAAVLIAQWGGGLLRGLLLPQVEWGSTLADRRVLIATVITALASGFLAGLAPAFQSGRGSLSNALRSGSRTTTQRSTLRNTLLVLQATLSVVLLVGAGLFVRSFHQVRTMPLGYDAGHLLLVNTELRGEALGDTARQILQRQLLQTARHLPGVSHAAQNSTIPFWSTENRDLFVAGIDSVARLGEFDIQTVSADYFTTTGTRILRGRALSDEDRSGSEPVMVVSSSMARTLWPGADPLAGCVRLDAPDNPCRRVVGVAEDIKAASLRDDPGLLYYLPIQQYPEGYSGLFVRTSGAADAPAAERVRRALQRQMPGASYVTVTPFSDVLQPEMRSWELGATMFTLFGMLALVVAVVGLYSVMAFNVVQRTHEMGVRVALGAGARSILSLILREAVGLTVLAIGVGSGIALVAGRWLQPLLFQTSARDPLILLGVAGLLLIVSAAASAVPAWRAARTDPNVALRSD